MSEIADHCAVSVRFFVAPLSFESLPRTVWNFSQANWSLLRARLRFQDWQWIATSSPDVSAKLLTDIILEFMFECIPSSSSCFRSFHPWLTDECLQLVEQKTLASGTEFFPEACLRCSAGLLHAHNCFIQRTRLKLRSVRRGSKLWWKLSNSIMSRVFKPSSCPLKRSDGSWAV